MAEAYNFAGHAYGDAGILSYRLADHHLGDQIGSLISTRHIDREPRFSIVGATTELYPPSKPAQPNVGSEVWRARREQRRWLIKAHPEAVMGNFAFQEPLRQDMAKFKATDALNNDGLLLAVGSMPTVSSRHSENKPVPFLASATGVSGEILRLAVAEKTEWEWEDNADASLQVSVIDPLQSEREVTWASDGLPITQIKYAQGRSKRGHVRWLLVQKGTSTTILQPEYHTVPTPNAHHSSFTGNFQVQVKPNPILKLRHTDTGGNAHSDVVFCSTGFRKEPILALIDECGFWSIWDLKGTPRIGCNSVRVAMQARGHIITGPLADFPLQHKRRAEKHGLVIVSAPRDAKLDPFEADTRTRSSVLSTPILLMWKATLLQAVAMRSDSMVPISNKFWAPEGKNNHILAVHNCPATESRIFILTEKTLVWADIVQDQGQPIILITVPHIGEGSATAKMTTCSLEDGTAMVFIVSIKTNQLFVYWFKTEDAGPVRWHRHVTSLPGGIAPSRPSNISHMTVTPLPLTVSDDENPSSLGTKYMQAGVEFFQVNALFDNLSLQSGIYTTTHAPHQDILLPKNRLAWSMTEQEQQRKKQRDNVLQRFESTFVLPDSMTERDLTSALQHGDADENGLIGEKAPEAKLPQPVRLNMERLCWAISRSLTDAQRAGPRGLPKDLFEAMQHIFNVAEPGSRTPLTTWVQLAEALEDGTGLDDVDNDMETEIERLFDACDEVKIVPQLRRSNDEEPADSLIGFRYLFQAYCGFWLDVSESRITDDVQGQRKVWIAEVARNMLLSSYGVLVQDVPLFGPQRLEAEHGRSKQTPSSTIITSSPPVQWSSREPPSSASFPSSLPSSQVTQSASTDGSDDAWARLCLLAPSLSTTQPASSRPHNLLSYWPSERGHDPEEYVSTVAVASDEKFRGARERREKRAKRRSRLDEFRRQSMMGQSPGQGRREEIPGSSPGPAVRMSILSSQVLPNSSQTQAPSLPVTMSQPVSGTHGARKKKAKTKKKAGFR